MLVAVHCGGYDKDDIICLYPGYVSQHRVNLAKCTVRQMIPSASQLATRAGLSGVSSTHFNRKAQGAEAPEHKHPVQSEHINLTCSLTLPLLSNMSKTIRN